MCKKFAKIYKNVQKLAKTQQMGAYEPMELNLTDGLVVTKDFIEFVAVFSNIAAK